MKNLTLIFILILFSTLLFSQVNFELDFSFEKIDPNDELTNLQLFDYDNDGVDEVFTGYNSNDLFNIVCHDLTGETLFIYEYEKVDDEVFQKMNIFSLDDIKYVITSSIIDVYGFEYDNLILIRIFNLANFEEVLLYEFNTGIPSFDCPVLPSINKIMTINNQENIQIIMSFNDGYYWDVGGMDPHNHDETFISKFIFDNNQLIFLETISQVGLEMSYSNSLDFIDTIGFEHDWGGMEEPFNWWHYYLKKISNETPAVVQNVLFFSYCSISQFTKLTKNDYSDQQFGYLYFIRHYFSNYVIEMKNYSNDLSVLLWERSDSEIGMGSITASTCVSTNEGNHFVLYFRSDLYEVRNRITGDIKLSGASTITPFIILRKSDGELLFFVEQEDETGYDVYVLEGEIQVSADDSQLPIANYELQNYPNPFNPSTTISFNVTQTSSFVNLDIYNLKGQKVKSLPVILSDAKHRIEGRGQSNQYSITWRGIDQTNNPVSSGIYFYQLKVDGEVKQTKKMMLIK